MRFQMSLELQEIIDVTKSSKQSGQQHEMNVHRLT